MRRHKGRSDDLLSGVLLVDKPPGPTSHDVVEAVKRALRLGKVGHGGTLDPFASGLLPLLLNGATRLMPNLQSEDKVYEAVVRFGARTDTQDPTGKTVERLGRGDLELDQVRVAALAFLGAQKQAIPRYSAARVDGKHLYEYARAGEVVETPTKHVIIHELTVGEATAAEDEPDLLDVRIFVRCSAGTYIRALAEDLGASVGRGAYLGALRRTGAGSMDLRQAIPLERIVADAGAELEAIRAGAEPGTHVAFVPEDHAARWFVRLGPSLLSAAQVLGGLPELRVPPLAVARAVGGQAIRRSDLGELGADTPRWVHGARVVLLEERTGRTIALVRAAAARDALDRREPGSAVFEIERVLR